MPETPRTWTLEMSPSGCDGEDFHVQALGPDVGWDEKPEVIEKAPVDTEIERLRQAQEHEIAMRLRVERKHVPAPKHLTSPEEVNRQRERAGKADAERERLLDLLEEIAGSGVAFKDDRLRYLDVQIDRGDWEQLLALLREYGRLGKGES
jgi:hypothetical protein